MRAKYSIALAAFSLARLVFGQSCPPELVETAHKVAVLRAVPPPFSPPCRTIKPQDVAQELDRKLRRDLPLTPELYIEALKRSGFVDGEPATIYAKVLEFYGSQVLGFYEPGEDAMVIVDSPAATGGMAAMVWAHELEHAAQQHRSRLPSRLLTMRSNSDRQRAASAIAEGDAMLVMLAISAPQASPEDLAGLAGPLLAEQAEALGAPPEVPDFFVRDLVFPYTAGLAAVIRVFRTGGWPAVDHLLETPPGSTAELLDPARGPTPAAVPEASLPPVPAGYEEVMTDVVGQWGLAFWLGRAGPRATADRLAGVWDGDRLRLVRQRGHNSRWALAWRIRCRDEAGRRALEAEMQQLGSALLARIEGTGRVELAWLDYGRELELRASWPSAPRPRGASPS
jgi:hypothetical protein